MTLLEPMKLENILPPAFLWLITAVTWSVHVFMHLIPNLRQRNPEYCVEQLSAALQFSECGAVRQTVLSQSLFAMYLYCFVKSMLTSPGHAPEWKLGAKEKPLVSTLEVKGSGDKRYCKWCLVYKPDRCHHCRLCGVCVLRMDHHCPWVINCIGYKNHKYFFLLLIYSLACCVTVAVTVYESVIRATVEETSETDRFLLVLCMVLASTMGFLLMVFLSFHIWLMLMGMTTIEFCEKTMRVEGGGRRKIALYDQGLLGNIKAVLGPRPWLWLLPMSLPDGDGISFTVSQVLTFDDGVVPEAAVVRPPVNVQVRVPGDLLASAILATPGPNEPRCSEPDPEWTPVHMQDSLSEIEQVNTPLGRAGQPQRLQAPAQN